MKATFYSSVFFVILSLVGTENFAQQAILKSDTVNSELRKLVKPESKPHWLRFKEDIKIDPASFFKTNRKAFDLTENDQMVLKETETDELGFTHFYYRQYYAGVQVDGATFTLHSKKDGRIYAANGNIFPKINLSTIPAFDSEKAVRFALDYVNATEYMWQSEFWQKALKQRTKNSDTSYYPIPKLVIKTVAKQKLDLEYHLAYRMDIYCSSPNFSQRVYIDATSGDILAAYPLQSN